MVTYNLKSKKENLVEGQVFCLCRLVLTWKKHALQQRGRPGGRGLLLPLVPPLSSSRARSRASSRSTILTADTNGVGFCRARARALLTTAHSSLPAVTGWVLRIRFKPRTVISSETSLALIMIPNMLLYRLDIKFNVCHSDYTLKLL